VIVPSAITVPAPSPTVVYEAALAIPGLDLWARVPDGRRRLLLERWRGALAAGDESLLERCDGPTLDVGCGPGRLAAALTARGMVTLGIDVAPLAVALARHAGAPALLRDIFGPLPGTGRWRTILLADGNIGIGGQPRVLLARVRRLLGPGGAVLIELAPPGTPSGEYLAVLEARPAGRDGGGDGGGDGGVDADVARAGTETASVAASAPFRWADVSADDIAPLAFSAGLRVTDRWREQGRYFARLECPTGSAPTLGTATP
jgi:SAM-dependent methyltransferase